MIKRILLSLMLLMSGCIGSAPSFATVTSANNQVIYAGDGVTSTFTFTFNVYNTASENDLVVSKQNTTTGAITTLAINTDYTVSLTHSIPSPGTITLVAGALASGTNLSILRQLPLTQQVNIADNSATPAATTNSVYDRTVMIDQQLQQQLTRAILQNIFSTTQISLPAGVAGLVLCWDPTAMFITNCTATGVQTIPVPIPNSYLTALTSGSLVNGSSLYSLASTSSGAGIFPVANMPFGTAANNLVKLDSSAKLPAVDGSALIAVNATSTGNQPYVKVTNSQTSGGNAGSATTGAWRTITLNTKDMDTSSIATLNSNQVTLPAGTYTVNAISPFVLSGLSQCRIQNITDSTTILTGTSVIAPTTVTATIPSFVRGMFTISSTKTLEFQYQVGTTESPDGLGKATGFGTEVYAIVEFIKIS